MSKLSFLLLLGAAVGDAEASAARPALITRRRDST